MINTPDKKVDALLIMTLNDIMVKDSFVSMHRLVKHIQVNTGITLYMSELEAAFIRAKELVEEK